MTKSSNNNHHVGTLIVALVLALSFMSLGGVAQAGFIKGMSAQQLSRELKAWLVAGKSLEAIAKATHEAGLKSEQVASILIGSGQSPAGVVAALTRVDPQAATAITVAALTIKPAQAAVITAAAISAAPQQSRAIILEALTVPEVDPSDVLFATAAGGGNGQ